MSKKKTKHVHTAAANGKCPTCGRKLTANGKPPVPLPADTKLERATRSALKALNQIKVEQGVKAAKAALARLTAALSWEG